MVPNFKCTLNEVQNVIPYVLKITVAMWQETGEKSKYTGRALSATVYTRSGSNWNLYRDG